MSRDSVAAAEALMAYRRGDQTDEALTGAMLEADAFFSLRVVSAYIEGYFNAASKRAQQQQQKRGGRRGR